VAAPDSQAITALVILGRPRRAAPTGHWLCALVALCLICVLVEEKLLAAGGIIIDNSTDSPRVLLVHRPRYDDWSFPKGKLDPGETVEEAALREVKEETGLKCRIIRKLAVMQYDYRTRRKGLLKPKAVHYFLMERLNHRIRVPGDEVDLAEWVKLDEAAQRLTYEQDRKLLDLL
jgi:8-oxo-dGTP pyrophosphatase MutT (NUDIX family)